VEIGYRTEGATCDKNDRLLLSISKGGGETVGGEDIARRILERCSGLRAHSFRGLECLGLEPEVRRRAAGEGRGRVE